MKTSLTNLIHLTAAASLCQQIGLCADSSTSQPPSAPEGWITAAPCDEIRPSFGYHPSDGRAGRGAFMIQHDARDGLDGYCTKTFPVQGGHYYRFQVFRKTDRVAFSVSA